MLYGAILAIGQDDMRRLIAYTSVSHFGFIVLGIFVFTSQGGSGSTLYMFNHGLSTAALFLVTGMLIHRHGSALISDYGGVQKAAPVLAGFFLVAGLSSLSLPGLSPFVSEFLVLAGHVPAVRWRRRSPRCSASCWPRSTSCSCTTHDDRARSVRRWPATPDLGLREQLALGPVIALIVALGFYPQVLARRHRPGGRRHARARRRQRTGARRRSRRRGEPAVISVAAEFEAPKVEYATILPLLVVLGAAAAGVLVEAFVPRVVALPGAGGYRDHRAAAGAGVDRAGGSRRELDTLDR